MTSSIGMDPVDVALTNERNGYSSFDMDYTPSPEAIDQVNRAFDYIEAYPEKWNQDTYGNHLTETNCFMGILCRINGKKTRRYAWLEDNGDVAGDFHDYSVYDGMELIEMYDPHSDHYGHEDRGRYMANFIEVYITPTPGVTLAYPYRHPTLDEMRERVSIAMNHDFRTPKNETRALNDPTVDCCKRDAADCDCSNAGAELNDRIHDQMN